MRLLPGIVEIIQTAPHVDHWTEAARRAIDEADLIWALARARELHCRRCQIKVDSSVPPQQARCPTCGGPMERA